MVKKRVKYNLDKLIQESNHRVLNEHEILYILGKLMLSETDEVSLDDKNLSIDDQIRLRSKWNPKRWMWQFQKMMDDRNKKTVADFKLIMPLERIAKKDPDYAIRILNTPEHSLTASLSPWQRYQLKRRYRQMSLAKTDKAFDSTRDKRVGIDPSTKNIQIKTTDPSHLSTLTGPVDQSTIRSDGNVLAPRSGRAISSKYPSGAFGISYYPDDKTKNPRFSVYTTPQNVKNMRGDLGPLSEGNGGQMVPARPQKTYKPDPQWVANLIKQLDLTPGDILSGNKLDLRKPSHLSLVNYYRKSKNLGPITQSGLTQDELQNNEGKYTDQQKVRANDKQNQVAYDNMQDIQNWSNDLLDANKVDYSSGRGNAGWFRRGLRSIGDWIKYGKEGDPNRTFKATATGGLSQKDIDENIGKIREMMRWFKIPGENQGEITNRQIYAFMNDVKQPVLILANGQAITKLQLMTLMKTGKVDPRTYVDIIREFSKEKKPVSLARDKVPVMEDRWNPETRKYEKIQKLDKNGNPVFRAATEEDYKNHKNQYVGSFSALDQKWQNTVNGFINPEGSIGYKDLILNALKSQVHDPRRINIDIIRQINDKLQQHVAKNPNFTPSTANIIALYTQLTANRQPNINDSKYQRDASGKLTGAGYNLYKQDLATYNANLNNNQLAHDANNKVGGSRMAYNGFTNLTNQADIATRNAILSVLHKYNLEVSPEIVKDIDIRLRNQSITNPTEADIRTAYSNVIQGKNTGFKAFAARTSATDNMGNPMGVITNSQGKTFQSSRYAESFTSELAGLVFIEAFAEHLLAQRKVLREGEEAVPTNDPNNPVDQAFNMVKPNSEPIPQEEDEASSADDAYYDTAVQAYHQAQQANQPVQSDRARGAQWGVNLVDKAHSWLTGVRDNFEIKQVRSSNPHIFALTQYALANPLSPRANSPEVQQYLTTSELDKIRRAQNRWISRFPDKTPPWIVPGEDDGSEASGMTQQAQGQGPQGQVQPSPTSAGSEAIQADQDSSAPDVKKDPYAFDINKKFDPNNLKNFFYTDKYGRLISAADKQPIESKQRVIVSDLKPEAQEFFYNNNKYYKKNKNGHGSQTSAGTSLLDRLYRSAASVSRQVPGNRSKMNGGKEKITITQSNKKDTSSFQNLFSRIQAGSIMDYNSNNFPIMNKFELDPSGQELRVKAANGNPAKTVVSLKDAQLNNVEFARYASDGRPILIVHKKDKVGRPFTKTIDLTRNFSESSSNILTYSQFKKQFKESIQKHSNEVSSKNMYQLYLLGKLKKLL